MAPDPHHQRFFAYLSMFTFFMLLLVCGDNFLVMFIGWCSSRPTYVVRCMVKYHYILGYPKT
jgi:hypothetical protein